MFTISEADGGDRRWRRCGVVAYALVAVFVLVVVPPFGISLVTQALGFAIAAMGLQVAVGAAGLPSLGHGAFLGFGAYAAVWLLDEVRAPLALIPLGVFALGAAAGAAVGSTTPRIQGFYLSLTTFALAAVFPAVIKRLDSLTGGVGGARVRSPLTAPGWTGIRAAHHWRFLVAAGALAVCCSLLRSLRRSRSGRAVLAVRDHAPSAEAMGVSRRRTLTAAFACSAGFSALGGAVMVLGFPFVGPERYGLIVSVQLFVAVALGGAASIEGAAAGGVAVFLVPWLSVQLHLPVGPNLLLGLSVLALGLSAQTGLAGAARRLERVVFTRVPAVPDRPAEREGAAGEGRTQRAEATLVGAASWAAAGGEVEVWDLGRLDELAPPGRADRPRR
ncbi:MAG: branched-chain amino acid ABC transporter permease [Acidimicrobiales bacterium]